jgi:hypothetical protein
MIKNLRSVAERARESLGLLPVVAFHYEFPGHLGVKLEELILNWDVVREELSKTHLTAFYAQVPQVGVRGSQRIQRFIECFGRDQLFQETDCILRAGYYFYRVAEYTLRLISSEPEVPTYDAAIDDLLTLGEVDFLLSGLVARSLSETDLTRKPDVIVEHFSKKWKDPRKYIVDWLILARILGSQGLQNEITDRCTARLKSLMRKAGTVQKFYSRLLLKKRADIVSMEQLGVGPQTYDSLEKVSKHLNYSKVKNTGKAPEVATREA